MKTTAALILCSVASVAAFAPAQVARSETSLDAKRSIFQIVSDMDLFAPVSDQNNYGARNKKNLKQGSIGSNSYVPSGLTADQYNKIRSSDEAKKNANYAKNVAKAFKFQDYTAFYTKRGTDLNQGWKKSVTLGHDMAKTKYDWSGKRDETKFFESAVNKKK
uniref:RxLR effector protein n=1 Tax=Leptocylindrus danicus TaxID=163516 RepID=A0A7S2P108_9STRA